MRSNMFHRTRRREEGDTIRNVPQNEKLQKTKRFRRRADAGKQITFHVAVP